MIPKEAWYGLGSEQGKPSDTGFSPGLDSRGQEGKEGSSISSSREICEPSLVIPRPQQLWLVELINSLVSRRWMPVGQGGGQENLRAGG